MQCHFVDPWSDFQTIGIDRWLEIAVNKGLGAAI
jgi:hypothetical protein